MLPIAILVPLEHYLPWRVRRIEIDVSEQSLASIYRHAGCRRAVEELLMDTQIRRRLVRASAREGRGARGRGPIPTSRNNLRVGRHSVLDPDSLARRWRRRRRRWWGCEGGAPAIDHPYAFIIRTVQIRHAWRCLDHVRCVIAVKNLRRQVSSSR